MIRMNEIKEVIDTLTGEVIESTSITYKKVKPDEFMQVYLEDMMGLMKISGEGQLHTLLWLWKDSTWFNDEDQYPGNKVTVNKQLLDFISEKTGKTIPTLRNVISSLVKKDLLFKDANYRGTYYLNPKYFFKGKLGDRTKRLSVVRNYELIDEQESEFDTQHK